MSEFFRPLRDGGGSFLFDNDGPFSVVPMDLDAFKQRCLAQGIDIEEIPYQVGPKGLSVSDRALKHFLPSLFAELHVK